MDQLYKALKSANETDDVLLRLIKKGPAPMLNFSITTAVSISVYIFFIYIFNCL